jgi:hypothetical protein
MQGPPLLFLNQMLTAAAILSPSTARIESLMRSFVQAGFAGG